MSSFVADLPEIPRFVAAVVLFAIAIAAVWMGGRVVRKASSFVIGFFEARLPPAELRIDQLAAASGTGDADAQDALDLLNLHAWLSPDMPVGEFLRGFDRAPMGDDVATFLPERIVGIARDGSRLERALSRLRSARLNPLHDGATPKAARQEMRRRQREDGSSGLWADAAAAVVAGWQDPGQIPSLDSEAGSVILAQADVLARSRGRSDLLLFVLNRAFRISDHANRQFEAALLLGALIKLERRMADPMVDGIKLRKDLADRALVGGRPALGARLWRSAAEASEKKGDVEGAAFARIKTAEAKAALANKRDGRHADVLLSEGASLLRRVVAMTAVAPVTRAKALFRLGTLQQRRGHHDEGARHLRHALDIDLAQREPGDPVLRLRLAAVAWDLMARGRAGALEALTLIEMALATNQGHQLGGFAEAEVNDLARLMAVCLILLAGDDGGAVEFESRAKHIIERYGLDGVEVAATAKELREGAPQSPS